MPKINQGEIVAEFRFRLVEQGYEGHLLGFARFWRDLSRVWRWHSIMLGVGAVRRLFRRASKIKTPQRGEEHKSKLKAKVSYQDVNDCGNDNLSLLLILAWMFGGMGKSRFEKYPHASSTMRRVEELDAPVALNA